MATLSDLVVRNTVLLHPEPKMQRVAGVIDLPEWQEGETHIIRMFAEPGEHISLPWFAVLTAPGQEGVEGLRKNVVLTNNRFLFDKDPDPMPGHGLGLWGWSWYIINNGHSVGPVRIEVGFVTTAMHPPATET